MDLEILEQRLKLHHATSALTVEFSVPKGGGGQPLETPTYYDSLLGTAKVGNLPISY